ncbi:TonB-dependent receptor [Sphingobium naphthae]|uniref:TonB-dependent receptor n=1 Tax=Sphingobium naphthae TaxID=1886786 RepID=UPI00374A1F76
MFGLDYGLLFGSAEAADAQSAQQSVPVVRPEDATSSGSAADAAGGIQDIVVTARKRDELAQKVPIAITVSTGAMLRDRSITKFAELQQQTPSLHITTSIFGSNSVILSSRGLALTDVRLNIDPVVGVYLDGVYLPRAVGVNADELVDIARVEVLAGPQGTLFGKNTSGGAISIFTQTPTNLLEGQIRARYGSYGDHSLSAVLNAPLTPTLAVRGVVSLSGRDGYGHNLYNGSRTGKQDSQNYRASAQWTPTDALKVTLRGDYTHSTSTFGAYKGLQSINALIPGTATTAGGPSATLEAALERNNIPSTAAFLALPLATRNAMLADADTALRTFSSGNPNDANQNVDGREEIRIWGVSGTLDYSLSDNLSLKSITAYRYFKRDGSVDLDGTPYAIIDYPVLNANDGQFSEEAQLSGDFLDGRLKSIVGAYYSSESGTEVTWQTALRIIAGANPTTFQNARVKTKSVGLYTQHTFKITNRLGLTGGVRWTHDSRSVDASNYNATNCLSLGVSLASLGGVANCLRPMSVTYNKVNYTASLDYQITPAVMVYATTRTGNRAGGLQEAAAGTTVAAANAAFTPFKPELVTDYEVGLKSELFQRHLRLNIDYYHDKISGGLRQVPVPVPGSTLTASSVQNAAAITVNGVEFDATAVPIPALEFSVSGAYTDAHFSNYVTPTGTDLSYLPVAYTPKWRVNVSAAYIVNTGIGRWRTQVDYSHEDRQLIVEPGAYSPAHDIVNARSTLNWDRAGIEFSIFGKNLTDRRYSTIPVDLSGSLGVVAQGQLFPPRTFGVELAKHF